jgi:hypothetical protein
MSGSAVGSAGGFVVYPSAIPGYAGNDTGAPVIRRSRYPFER